MKALTLLAIVSLLFSVAALADRDKEFKRDRPNRKGNERSERVSDLQVADAMGQGNGCPEGTMRVAFAPDNLSFSILFDKFVAEVAADGNRVRNKDRMACTVIVPMLIPEGMQMSVTRIDYRGFAALSEGSRAMLQSRISFFERDRARWGDGRAKDATQLKYAFQGPTAEDYLISSGAVEEGDSSPVAYTSPCGGAVRLRIDNSLTVVSRRGQDATLTLDSIDGSSNAVYFVNWQKCVDNTPDKGPKPGGPRFPRGFRDGRDGRDGFDSGRDFGRGNGRGNNEGRGPFLPPPFRH